MASQFAEKLLKKIDQGDGMLTVLETPEYEDLIDAELQEVREVLQGLRDNDCYDDCWHRWGKERGDDQYHSDSCQRARELMKRLTP